MRTKLRNEAHHLPPEMSAANPVSTAARPSAPIGALERLPKWLLCIPLVAQWLWLALRYRSLTLPSAANPRITCGGMVGEGKSEYFEIMGPCGRAATARSAPLSHTGAGTAVAAADWMRSAGLEFPLIAKPDIGWCGYGVRRIESQAALDAYLAGFPEGERLILQEYVGFEGEAGLFYVREPDSPRGRLIALALRYFPQVRGDGRRNLSELIAADPRARRLLTNPLHDFPADRDAVPAAGAIVRLATIGSTRVGGLYRDGARLISSALTEAVDAIAREMDFHFGRFDVRFETEAALSSGAFRIIEVNGAGSEIIDAWDPDVTMLTGFARVFAKQRLLFAVADANRRRGHRPVGWRKLAQLHLRQQRLIGRYPHSN